MPSPGTVLSCSEPRRSPAGLFVDLPCLLPEGCGQYDLCAASLSYMPHVCRTTSPFVWRTRTSRQKVLCFDGFISNRIGLSCDVGPTRLILFGFCSAADQCRSTERFHSCTEIHTRTGDTCDENWRRTRTRYTRDTHEPQKTQKRHR